MSGELTVEAMVLGAGAAGLGAAAALSRVGVRPLVLERDVPGASWRSRYDGLRLNTWRLMSGLPGRRPPRALGRWPDRDGWADYLALYAERERLDVRTGVEVSRVDRDADGRLTVTTSDAAVTTRVVVVATGRDRVPVIPDWSGRGSFDGRLLHSSEFRNPEPFRDQRVLVVGTGNSACEIAHLLSHRAAKVWVSVRTPPLILRREYLHVPLTALALAGPLVPDRIVDRVGWLLQRLTFGDLSGYGLPRSPRGLSRMRRKPWSPPVDSGFVDDVKRGTVEVVAAVEAFEHAAVVLADGRRVEPDAVVAATGYRPCLEPLVGHLGVLGKDGEPAVCGGETSPQAPGLFFAGFTFGLAALLPYIQRDARAIARAAAALVAEPPRGGARPATPAAAAG
jgi:putative flavoprotein involved in K+ transport